MSWSEKDRQLALDWHLDKNRFCHECGTDPAEWMDGEGRRLVPPPLVVETTRCRGCVALDEARKLVPSEERGIHFHFKPNPEIRTLP